MYMCTIATVRDCTFRLNVRCLGVNNFVKVEQQCWLANKCTIGISKSSKCICRWRVPNAYMPCTTTLHKVMMQLPLTAKGVNNIEAIKGT